MFWQTIAAFLATALYKASAMLLSALFALLVSNAQPAPQPDHGGGAIRLALDREGRALVIDLVDLIGFLRRVAAWARATASKLKLGLMLGNGGAAYA
ncbi:MAG TPA: hypothetical protein VG889_07150 [Rhizomicrobium sp.]|nr:hypothetical protein [Rhizomicrobium sp.]